MLDRARDRFSRFTHGDWRLEIDREDGFKAFDVKEQQLRPLERCPMAREYSFFWP